MQCRFCGGRIRLIHIISTGQILYICDTCVKVYVYDRDGNPLLEKITPPDPKKPDS